MKIKALDDNWQEIVIYADYHFPIQDKQADKILKEYIRRKYKRITGIYDLGDGIDNPYMSGFAHDINHKFTPQEEIDLYAQHWKEIDTLCPNCEKVVLVGNHDKGRLDQAKNLNEGLASLRSLEYENLLKESLVKFGVDSKEVKIYDPSYIIKLTKTSSILLTHGDPRIDTNVKGGTYSVKRTGEAYPFDGDIYMGHRHVYEICFRRYAGKGVYCLGMMADIGMMKKSYNHYNPYSNGFAIVRYNKKEDIVLHTYVPIVNGTAVIDGKVYQ